MVSFNAVSALARPQAVVAAINSIMAYLNGMHFPSIAPAMDNTYDLGTIALRWLNLYANQLHVTGVGSGLRYLIEYGDRPLSFAPVPISTGQQGIENKLHWRTVPANPTELANLQTQWGAGVTSVDFVATSSFDLNPIYSGFTMRAEVVYRDQSAALLSHYGSAALTATGQTFIDGIVTSHAQASLIANVLLPNGTSDAGGAASWQWTTDGADGLFHLDGGLNSLTSISVDGITNEVTFPTPTHTAAVAPTVDAVSDLGNSTHKWRNVYVAGGVRVGESANGKQGVATLVAGTVTVANTSITATSRIQLTSQADGGTPGFLRVSARTPGTSFTITSSNVADTSVVAYEIFEVA